MTIKLYSNERTNKTTGEPFTSFYTYIKQPDGADKPFKVKFPRYVNPPKCPCSLILNENCELKSFSFGTDKNGYPVMWIRAYEVLI